MTKRILSILISAALIVFCALTALAAEQVYGPSYEPDGSDASQAIVYLTSAIKADYGVEAYFIVNDGLSGEGSAKEYADSVITGLTDSDDVILYVKASDDDFIKTTGVAKTAYGTDEKYIQQIYADVKYAEQSGDRQIIAAAYFDSVNETMGDISKSAYGGGIPDDQTEPQPDDNLEVPEDAELLISAYGGDAGGMLRTRLIDNAGLLSDAEFETVRQKLDEVSEKNEFDVAVATVDSLNGMTAGQMAQVYSESAAMGAGRDGCLLLVSIEDRDWYILPVGYGTTAIDKSGSDYIGEKITPDMSKGDYASAFVKYADLVDDFVTQAKTGEPYSEKNMPGKEPHTVFSIVGSVILGALISLISTLGVKGKYKPVGKKTSASDYQVRGSFELTDSSENFRTSNVTQKPINTGSTGGDRPTGSGASSGSGGKF